MLGSKKYLEIDSGKTIKEAMKEENKLIKLKR